MMKQAKLTSMVITLFTSLLCSNANAFLVDKMFVLADEKGNGLVTLTNNEERNLFINTNIRELEFAEDGVTRIEKSYDRDNVSE